MDASVTIREFTLQFLEQITDNFSEKLIIGTGGYGVVYKGVLDNGEEIALKKLHHMPGLDDIQFKNEFNNLMRAQHLNITRLVGYCYNLGPQRFRYKGEYIFAQVEERVLCFEYLQGGSLDKHISDESSGLDWHTRFNIIKGVCEGLNYLHNGCKDPIYHLDLKPENILLDKNMIPKIGDFGLSRLFPSSHTCITKKATGTPGYMPPEYIERQEITSKYDVFSLGVTIVRIVAGENAYSKSAQMSSQEFLEHVHKNWGKRLQETMSPHTSEQVKTCIEIALRCVEVDRLKRPTIAKIVDELNKVDTTESSITVQVAKNQNSNLDRRGRIIFSTSKPPMSFNIFSCPFSPSSVEDELPLIYDMPNNYNGHPIPPAALKILLKSLKLTDEGSTTDADVDAGHVFGLVFVCQGEDGLETLRIAVHFNVDSEIKIFSLADIFGITDFSGMRLEDHGCIGGGYSVGSRMVDHYLIYVSTKESESEPEWRDHRTIVYKTSLITGKTERLTPQGDFDLSPAVSPSGKTVAVASFQGKSWQTDIYVMNVDNENGLGRKLLIKDGGWPSWGSDNIIFFHRGTEKRLPSSMVVSSWGVFRYNLNTEETVRVTPKELDAMTPAAISETKVAVATIRGKYNPYSYGFIPVEAFYQHIEIFDMDASGLPPLQITQKTRPESNHYNPFVLDGGGRIGYHRFTSELNQHGENDYPYCHNQGSPVKDVGLYRVSRFPDISKDGSKLAFLVSFKEVWVSDSQGERMVYQERGPNSVVLGPAVWNQNPDKDILYVCIGHYYQPDLEIYSIDNVSGPAQSITVRRLTHGGFRNAFPSTCPDGNKLVFTSTRPSENYVVRSTSGASFLDKINSPLMRENQHYRSNLYIMLNTDVVEESEEGWVTRLTNGPWTDTRCQWSPNGDWVVFSSTRGAAELNNVRPYSVYLVKAGDPTVVIRVMKSAGSIGAVFSPDGRSIAVTIDHQQIPVESISLPGYTPRVMGYNIIVVDINSDDDLKKNKDVIKGFHRIMDSKYECWARAWTSGLGTDTYEKLTNMLVERRELYSTRSRQTGANVSQDVKLTNKMWVASKRRHTI